MFFMVDNHGSPLGKYETREEAEAALVALVEKDPDAIDECGIVEVKRERKDYTDGLFQVYLALLDERDALQQRLDMVQGALDVVLGADAVREWTFSERLVFMSLVRAARQFTEAKENDVRS